MYSLRNRGLVAVIAIFLITLAVVPASAAPWEPAPLAQAGDGLFAQLWDWLDSLFALGAPPETNEAGTCTPTGGDRGCAIDPNG